MSSDTEFAIAPASSTDSDTGDLENKDLLNDLRCILAEQSHLFACGGDLSIREPKVSAKASGQTKLSSPPSETRESATITIRWDLASDDQACAKFSLPEVQGAEDGLDRLLQHARPATFGRGGQDVYDEGYRKALQIDPAAFCTTFDPYSVGIIDAVAQVLLPSVSDSTTHRAVRAELYKLNVSKSSLQPTDLAHPSVPEGTVFKNVYKDIFRTFRKV